MASERPLAPKAFAGSFLVELLLNLVGGLPGGSHSALQCRRPGFNPRFRNRSHAAKKKLRRKETDVCDLGKFQFIDFSFSTSSFFCSFQEIFAYLLQGHDPDSLCFFPKLCIYSTVFRSVTPRELICVYGVGRDQSLSNCSSPVC